MTGRDHAAADAPGVLAFGGHRLRADPHAEGRLRERLDEVVGRVQPVSAHGSLACGADLLWAEAVLAADTDLHVVLPFDLEPFLAVSVRPGGASWEARALAVLERATTVTVAAPGPFRDDVLYAHAAERFLGAARLAAARTDTQPTFAAVWDGQGSAGPAGTGADVARWRSVGGRFEVVEPHGERVRGGAEVALGPALAIGAVTILWPDRAPGADLLGFAEAALASVGETGTRSVQDGERLLVVTSVVGGIALCREAAALGPLLLHGGVIPAAGGVMTAGPVEAVRRWRPDAPEGPPRLTEAVAALVAMAPGAGLPVPTGESHGLFIHRLDDTGAGQVAPSG